MKSKTYLKAFTLLIALIFSIVAIAVAAEYNKPWVKTAALYLNNVLVTSTAAEINKTDGITGTILTSNVAIDSEDTGDGGAANGPIIKKTLQAGEAYTTTTAGLMVKNYGDALATVPSGEFTGLYVNLKGLHTDPGNNTSLISAHVHGSNTTTVHTGVWLYGDMTNGLKASGSTLTTMIDSSEATSVTNFASMDAGTDKAAEASVVTPTGNTTHVLRILIDGSPVYLPCYSSKALGN